MRMPRTSSFSVRDILDLPQIKATSDSETPNGNGTQPAIDASFTPHGK